MAWTRCYDVFAAHEIEQLSCIEYMLTQDIRVASKCNPLIATDHVIGDGRIEEIVSRGLCYVRKIINAPRIPEVMVELLPRIPGRTTPSKRRVSIPIHGTVSTTAFVGGGQKHQAT
ncbi:unnamed protein product [Clonostachys byssicola]|uniref:Uncharacterized protein n=1 Tax=Clonostachys byssicola TaxID=160290 RepID=A0A9N9UG33_9HYPO|nr:unnamed protein product [Clonostachys byssicola]